MAVQIRDAVKKAAEYFTEVMDEKVSGVMLEEVDNSDGNDLLVTLSAWVPENKPPISEARGELRELAEMFRSSHIKIYRIFDVDTNTGAIKSMKIRKVE